MTEDIRTRYGLDRFGWRPIETAPKDGSCILLFVESSFYGSNWQVVGRWGDIDESGKYQDWVSPLGVGKQRVDSCTSSPIHWKSLSNPTQPDPLIEALVLAIEKLEDINSYSTNPTATLKAIKEKLGVVE